MHFFEGIGNQRYSKHFLKRNKHETEAFRKLLTNDWRNRLFILYCRQIENPIAKFYPPQKNSRLKYQWSSLCTTKNTPSAQINEQTTQILSQLDLLDLNKSNPSKLTFFFWHPLKNHPAKHTRSYSSLTHFYNRSYGKQHGVISLFWTPINLWTYRWLNA